MRAAMPRRLAPVLLAVFAIRLLSTTLRVHMSLDTKTADAALRVAFRHIRKGTPIERAWVDVVAAARPGVGARVAKAALELPITMSLVTVVSEYLYLLGRDQPGKRVKGLWFGLVEFGMGDEDDDDSVWVPYLAGTRRFDPEGHSWPVGPAWMAEDCYAPNEAMRRLSALRKRHRDQQWLIETALIEPFNALMAGAIAWGTPPAILLGGKGGAVSRGIGCGFDDGDVNVLGVVGRDGFVPARKV